MLAGFDDLPLDRVLAAVAYRDALMSQGPAAGSVVGEGQFTIDG